MRQNKYSINQADDTRKRMLEVFSFLGVDPNNIPSNYTHTMDESSFSITDLDKDFEISYDHHLYQIYSAIRVDDETTKTIRLTVGRNLFELEDSIYREYDTKHFRISLGMEQNFELRVLHEENQDQDLFIKNDFGKFSIGSNNRRDLANIVCDDISFRGYSHQLADIRDSFIKNHMDDIQTDLQQLDSIQPGCVRFLRSHSEKMKEVEAIDMTTSRKGISLFTEGYSEYIKSVMGLKTKNNIIKRMI